jgi:hypothetical protein
MTPGASPVTDIATARQTLQSARRDLDDAVGLLPGLEGDDTMASPNLIALLLRTVVARRNLESLERAPGPASALSAATEPARDRWR